MWRFEQSKIDRTALQMIADEIESHLPAIMGAAIAQWYRAGASEEDIDVMLAYYRAELDAWKGRTLKLVASSMLRVYC